MSNGGRPANRHRAGAKGRAGDDEDDRSGGGHDDNEGGYFYGDATSYEKHLE